MEAVTLRAVGRAAGISRQAPYRHFVDKEDLLSAVAGCQRAGQLPAGNTVDLAALMGATSHGAVDQPLSGHIEAKKGQGDPLALVRLLFSYLRTDGRP